MERMNKLSLLFAFLLFLGTRQVSAQSLKEVFSSSETPVFYLGIDCTQARVIDAPESASDIKEKFGAINDLILSEPKKYDLPGAFHKSNINHDVSLVAKRNEKVNIDQIKSSNSADYDRLKEEDISNLVKSFDYGDKKGVGLLFVVDGMSKAKKAARIWVTFIDMGAKKMLMTEPLEGKPAGFGLRNYWAGAIKDMLEDIEKKKYKEWKSKYGG